MCREMRRQRIERALDLIVIGDIRFAGAEAGEPGRALPVVGEQAVDIGADDPAVGRNRAFGRAVGKPRKRPRAIRALRSRPYASRSRKTARRRAVVPRHRFEALVVRQRGCDFEQTEAFDRCRRAFDAVGIGDRAAQHLITAA